MRVVILLLLGLLCVSCHKDCMSLKDHEAFIKEQREENKHNVLSRDIEELSRIGALETRKIRMNELWRGRDGSKYAVKFLDNDVVSIKLFARNKFSYSHYTIKFNLGDEIKEDK